MRNALVLALTLPLIACVVGSDDPGGGGGGGGGGGSGSGSGSGSGGGSGINGTISQNTTWSGNVLIDGVLTIDAGATVTVEAGTAIKVKNGVAITVAGILEAQGTSAAKITIDPEATAFGGFLVNQGG